MSLTRALLRNHQILAILLVAVALFVKALVPTGYMVSGGQKLLSVQLCLDGSEHKTVQIAIPADDRTHDGHQDPDGKASDSPCAFTALSLTALGGADAPLLALAIAFLLALGFAPVRLAAPKSVSKLLPPSCGPPAVA